MDRILYELYNHPINPDQITLINREVEVYDNLPIFKSKVEHSIKNLKKGKATGVYNIPENYLSTVEPN